MGFFCAYSIRLVCGNPNPTLAPPVGILLISGCTADLCINILLTILGLVIPRILSLVPLPATPSTYNIARPYSTSNLLTNTSYVPGLIHALYLEHVYYSRRDPRALPERDAPGVYSDRIQHGGHHHQTERTYGTV